MTDAAARRAQALADLPRTLEYLALQVGGVATEICLDRRASDADRARARILADAQRRIDDCARLVRDLRD